MIYILTKTFKQCTTVQKFGVSKIFSVFESFFYVHKDCIYLFDSENSAKL